VRHEAAEALGAIADPDCLQLLQHHAADACQEVAETCQLALGRLAYLEQKKAAEAAAAAGANGTAEGAAAAGEEQSPYYSVDPTPALPSSTPIEQLRALLLDPKAPMFEVGKCYDVILYCHHCYMCYVTCVICFISVMIY
jgi:deoxyhypusine monooxygenase